MKNSNKVKRFFTMDRHHAGGFTLVELVVVIAILAILAGVAIPAYSGYVEKANKQTDISLVREVRQALELAHYAQKLPNGGMVVLTKDGVKMDELSADSKAALEAVFGSVDSIPGLVYDDWNGDYEGGSFQGNEDELLQNVEGLTGQLAGYLMPNAEGKSAFDPNGRFGTYMKTELGFTEADLANTEKVADAAVLYVAHTTNNLPADQQKALESIGSKESVFDAVDTVLNVAYKDNLFVGAAAAYAIMVGYCEHNNITVGAITPPAAGTSVSQSDVVTMLQGAFGQALQHANTGDNWKNYAKSQAAKDAAAFGDVMGAVDSGRGLVADNLGTAGCFSTAEIKALVDNFAAGNVVVLAGNKNDKLDVTLVPEVMNAE